MKTNYLNNRDLLKEIHLSKNTYCSFIDPEKDHQYDIILLSLDEINNNTIQQAKQNRITRILKEEAIQLTIEEILDTDLVFRVSTWEHIPLLPPKIAKPLKKKSKKNDNINRFFEEIVQDEEPEEIDESIGIIDAPIGTCKADHIRINFPPFFHYRLNINGEPILVGKSHWHGDLDTGEYCKTHGMLTENLALMIMKLAEKYSMKGNWRNYSYREEMEGQAVLQLCQVALQFDESKSSNPFAFFTTIGRNSFLRILNIEKTNQELRDNLLIQAGVDPSYSCSQRNSSFGDE